MPHGIVIEIIGDERSYLRSVEGAMAANTKLDASFKSVAANAALSAKAQVAAALKAEQAQTARIASLRALAAASPAGSRQQAKAIELADAATISLARSQGRAVTSTHQFSAAAKEGEKDLNKLVRGGLAGSGALNALGRSLAFASTGFIAFATGATIIKESIGVAQELAAAQRRVDTQLKTGGKSWDQYGARISAANDKLRQVAGFTDTELLQAFSVLFRATNNVGTSLTFLSVAADAARALNKPLAATSVALGKALGGNLSALRRLGVSIPKNLKGMEALTFVQAKFANQAEAGTTASERFHAELEHTGAVIGTALLPTFTRLASELSAWLSKMNATGETQRDVNAVVSAAGDVFHTLSGAIKAIDDVTGSFKNTLETLLAVSVTRVIVGTWIPALEGLAAKWGLVGSAATAAGAAQTEAAAASGVAGAKGAAGATASRGILGGLSNTNIAAIVAATAVVILHSSTYRRLQSQAQSALPGPLKHLADNAVDLGKAFIKTTKDMNDAANFLLFGKQPGGRPNIPTSFVQGTGGLLQLLPIQGLAPGHPPPPTQRPSTTTRQREPVIFKTFTDTITNQLAQARAALTKSTADDVAAAKAEIAFIKREIKAGHLKGTSLIQALEAQASAVSTIQAAEAAAVQAQTARLEAAIDPVRLEIRLARAELSGSTPRVIKALKALRAAAQKMLDSGKLSAEQQLRALQQIISLNQQIKDAATTATAQFQVPAKLAFRLARDTALGRDTTKDLLAIRKALLRFIATHKHNLAALTDAYNQLADINQQLGASAQSAFGTFHQASTRLLTQGLGLTPEQRKALRARLSQLGPGGTVPGEGVGAAGFIIGPDGRPIRVKGRGGATISARESQTVSPQRFNRLLRVLERTAERPIRVVVDLDGKIIADNTTRHQQRRRRHNPSQRRGPNAATT